MKLQRLIFGFAFLAAAAAFTAVSCKTPEGPTPGPKEVRDVLKYTSTDGRPVSPNNADAFGAEILSNEYKDGVGTISFADKVTAIGDRAFKGCKTLKNIDLTGAGLGTKAPEATAAASGGITAIGVSAFEGCTSLLDITIPSTVSTIGDAAFKGCSSLRSINLLSETPPAAGKDMMEGADCSIVVPSGAESAYDGASGWNAYKEQINGALPEPELIDLGLPSGLRWASCNVGASTPEEAGLFFAWAETKTKDSGYHWLNYKYGTNLEVTKYNQADGLIVLDALDDVATLYLGEKWRTPTSVELQELIDNCDWSKATVGGKKGYQGKSKVNGKTIFLPLCGTVEGGMEYSVYGEGEYGFYWSSELAPPGGVATDAWYLSIYEDSFKVYEGFRVSGYQVRPVQGDLIPAESVVLDKQTVTVSKGEAAIVNYTVYPENASLKGVKWTSSNDATAVVSAGNGRVVGRSPGSAVITATTAFGGMTGKCQVTVVNPSYPVPEAIDLGLPSGLRWASFNLGASAPEKFGVYFAWGETEPNGTYSPEAYSLYDIGAGSGETILKKYVTNQNHGTVDGLTTLEESDDAASVLLKGGWRIPTGTDFQELLDNCNCVIAKENGVPGYKLTSKVNGRSIFLPAAGTGYNNGKTGLTGDSAGLYTCYWTSSIKDDDRYPLCLYGFGPYDGKSMPDIRIQMARCTGLTLRPVLPGR